MLEAEQYRAVSSTHDPREVCALHRRHDYDLILLDLQLPGMDGFEVIAALKANQHDAYLPVMVITAQPGHKLRALATGVRDFISKPFDLIEVKARIRNMLEVRLLYRQLLAHDAHLQTLVDERTATLRESEARYRSLTELASDWYWEQDETGSFTRVSGPVLEMLGLKVDPLEGPVAEGAHEAGWNEPERAALRAKIAAREPFLDYVFSRTEEGAATRYFQVSGQPMFDRACRFVGYRGIGLELLNRSFAHGPV